MHSTEKTIISLVCQRFCEHSLEMRPPPGRRPASTLLKVILTGGLLSLGLMFFLIGPLAIHAGYRAATPDSIMQDRVKEYNRLENAELQLTGPARIENAKTRGKLFLWFHARGHPIDEGDEESSLWQPWIDLIGYWVGDDGLK
jgi:hypothetical protein